MSLEVKQSALKQEFTSFVWMENGHPLLQYERPIAHTRGVYGINYVVRYVPNNRWDGVAILCGDRRANMPILRDFDWENYYRIELENYFKNNPNLTEKEKRDYTQEQLIQFVTHVIKGDKLPEKAQSLLEKFEKVKK